MSILRVQVPNRRDLLIALVVALIGLTVYVRVLAPDVLYSDSGEFQTLAYTWATTHTTGYPVYLFMARLVGLLPVGTLAWRINFASALFAAITLGGVYLVGRYFTNRGGAILGSLVLLLSYTFWSQSIIAEVYAPATALIVVVLLTLLYWREQPEKRRLLLFIAGFVLGVGLGVHMFLLLIAPSAFLFVLWGILFGDEQERGHWRNLLRLIAGGIAGLALFFLLFAYMDTRLTPTNLLTTSIVLSREAWNLADTDLDSVPERFWISVSGHQWQSRIAPSDVEYDAELKSFYEETLPREFATVTLLLAGLGGLAALVQSRRGFALLAVALLTAFAAGFLYFPGDKFIFYLPFYILLAIFAGIGAGTLVALVVRFTPAFVPRAVPAIFVSLLLMALCAAPLFATRWRALERGVSFFITEEYVYPVARPLEPRRVAECAVSKVAEPDAVLVLDWRALYAIYYVAHVEQGRTGLVIYEARPYPLQSVSPTLSAEITERLENGQAVYTDDNYAPLSRTYTLTPVTGGCADYRLFKLSLRA